MDRYVQRAEAQREYSFPVLFPEVGQRDVVAVEERSSEIIISDIQAPPTAVRHLIDKAEDALISALPDGERFKPNSQRIIGVFFDANGAGGPVPTEDLDRQTFIGNEELIVDAIADHASVDRNEPVSRLQATPGSSAFRQDF
jgi:hypothetical protein